MGENSKSTLKTLAKGKGPHLPNSILKTIADEKRPLNSDEEGVPEEESKKNNHYDLVDNYEDENVETDDEEDGGNSDNDDEEEGEGDDDRYTQMLQSFTGMPSSACKGESESKPVITMEDLLVTLQGKPGYNQLRKRITRMQKDTQSLSMRTRKTRTESGERTS